MPPDARHDSELDRAVAALRAGGLVAFPTETVYGLGADASNERAVARIFAVKGRPSHHPLIVHLASRDELEVWARRVPEAAWRLARACWPGPLTLLLEKSERVPAATTGGLPSVGLRVPAHPLALELLRRFGGGIAAPSANRFGRVSPTSAAHVHADLGSDVEVVLDGGACDVGVESTIVDMTGELPVLVRPGGITLERIEAIVGGRVSRDIAAGTRAPGLLASHYAPNARVEITSTAELAARARELATSGRRVTVLVSSSDDRARLASLPGVSLLDLGVDDREAARRLYAALRQADQQAADVILASRPLDAGLGEALADRLAKAAGPREPG